MNQSNTIICFALLLLIIIFLLIKNRRYKKAVKQSENKQVGTSTVSNFTSEDINIWNKKRVNFTLGVIIKERLDGDEKHVLGSNDIERAGSRIVKALKIERFSSQQYIIFAGEYSVSADIGINIDEVYIKTKDKSPTGEIESIHVIPNIQPSRFETLFPKVFIKGIMKGDMSKGAKIYRDITDQEQEMIDNKAILMAHEQAFDIAIPMVQESIESSLKLRYPNAKVIISKSIDSKEDLIPYKSRIDKERLLKEQATFDLISSNSSI